MIRSQPRFKRKGTLLHDTTIFRLKAEALQAFEKVGTRVIEKTGTLTEGKPKLVAIETVGGWAEDALLALAAAVEARSEHPLAHAIAVAAEERTLSIGRVEDFASQTGQGVSAMVDDIDVVIGNTAQMERVRVDTAPVEAATEQRRADRAVVILGCVDGPTIGRTS